MLQKIPTQTKASLVQCRSDTSLAVFQSMTGDGTFGVARWVTWNYNARHGLSASSIGTPLTHEEQCRICDLHVTHFSWWIKVDRGAFMVMIPYGPGISGTALPYPKRITDSDGGGSRV